MKNMIMALGSLVISASAFATSGALDGKSYCRTIVSGRMPGQPPDQPKTERKHCVSFDAGIATDNANSFFGNPPERAPYEVNKNEVYFGSSEYTLSEDEAALTTVKGSAVAGTILNLQ